MRVEVTVGVAERRFPSSTGLISTRSKHGAAWVPRLLGPVAERGRHQGFGTVRYVVASERFVRMTVPGLFLWLWRSHPRMSEVEFPSQSGDCLSLPLRHCSCIRGMSVPRAVTCRLGGQVGGVFCPEQAEPVFSISRLVG